MGNARDLSDRNAFFDGGFSHQSPQSQATDELPLLNRMLELMAVALFACRWRWSADNTASSKAFRPLALIDKGWAAMNIESSTPAFA